METVVRVNGKKTAIAALPAIVFILGIPSLPLRPYHWLFWAVAFLVEALVLFALWPVERTAN